MHLGEFQKQIENIYFQRDQDRGVEGTFRWFVEEVGELARAIRKDDKANLEVEFSDCLAWLLTLASLLGVEMEKAVRRYGSGCPKCRSLPCSCAPELRKERLKQYGKK